jgi:hypothetical protein
VCVGNVTLQYKIGRYLDTTSGGSVNGIVPGILVVQNLTAEFKPYYTLSTDGKYMIWHDFSVIKLGHLF